MGLLFSGLLGSGLGVHRLGKFVRRVGQRIDTGIYRSRVVGLERLLEFRSGRFDLFLVLRCDFVTVLLQRFLGLINQRIGIVARFDHLLLFSVVFGIRLGLAEHVLNLVLAEPARRFDPDLLLFVRR